MNRSPDSASAGGSRIRFFNTFEPVTSLYRDLLPALADDGMRPEIVISRAEYRGGRGQSALANGATVRRIVAPAGRLRGRLSRAAIIASYGLGASALALAARRADVNVFLTQPPLFATLGRGLQLLRGQPYVCVIMDLYPHLAIRAGLLAPRSLLTRALQSWSLALLQNAASVVVIGRCMRDTLIDRGVDPRLIRLIPNWADTELVVPVAPQSNTLRHELGLTDCRVVMYSGNLGVSHDLADFVAAARRLRGQRRIRFVIAGGGAGLNEVTAACDKYRLDNVITLPFQPAARLAESLSIGDLHFVSLRPGFEGLVVPSKAYGAMAAGRPVIYQGDARGEVAQMIAEEGGGAVIAPRDVDGLTATILDLCNADEKRERMGQVARRLAAGRFGKERGVNQYRALIERLCRGERA